MPAPPGSQSDSPSLITLVLPILFAVDAVIVGTIVGSQASPLLGLAVGAGAFVLPLVAIPLVVALLNRISGWTRLAAAYPGQPPAPDARRGDASTLGVGWRWLGYNGCIRWAADEHHLHLRIIPLFAPLARPMSIPWSDIDFDESAAPIGSISPLVPLETAQGTRLFVPPQLVEGERARRLAGAAATG